MTRHIRIDEPTSALSIRVRLLDELAPRFAQALWSIAAGAGTYEAIHAMWTGPEISCPIPETMLPPALELMDLALENATSYPDEGDIALVYAARNAWKGQPGFGFLDVGIFYGRGSRLLMPMGWIQASIAGQVVPEDLAALGTACQRIRRSGVCRLRFSREPD